MKLTNYGRKEWLRATVCAAVLLILCAVLAVIVNGRAGLCLAVFVVVLWAAFAAFFRDPERQIPSDERILTSPAACRTDTIRNSPSRGLKSIKRFIP